MIGKNICLPVMLLFIIGVERGKPLKCFQCDYIKAGEYNEGQRECENLKPSDTHSSLLMECNPLVSSSCYHIKSVGDSGAEQWIRGCTHLENDGCLEPTEKRGLTTTKCFCKGDACNRAPGVTLSSTLLTLCMSWAALRNVYLLF